MKSNIFIKYLDKSLHKVYNDVYDKLPNLPDEVKTEWMKGALHEMTHCKYCGREYE